MLFSENLKNYFRSNIVLGHAAIAVKKNHIYAPSACCRLKKKIKIN